MLSNNRLTEEGEELVDCRGHPIAQSEDISKQIAESTQASSAGEESK